MLSSPLHLKLSWSRCVARWVYTVLLQITRYVPCFRKKQVGVKKENAMASPFGCSIVMSSGLLTYFKLFLAIRYLTWCISAFIKLNLHWNISWWTAVCHLVFSCQQPLQFEIICEAWWLLPSTTKQVSVLVCITTIELSSTCWMRDFLNQTLTLLDETLALLDEAPKLLNKTVTLLDKILTLLDEKLTWMNYSLTLINNETPILINETLTLIKETLTLSTGVICSSFWIIKSVWLVLSALPLWSAARRTVLILYLMWYLSPRTLVSENDGRGNLQLRDSKYCR